jgi:bifunctional DNA-binding transcriptional regulator/antitoxin component of YhaV-PrlF toxin-antitoxin module
MVTTSFQARIVGNNQITIPAEAREFLCVGVGDLLDIDVTRVKRKTDKNDT